MEIGPFCVIGPDVRLGNGVRLASHVTIAGHTSIGARTAVDDHAALGEPPQDTRYKGEPTSLVIGEDVLVGAFTTMHRGTSTGGGKTVVGNGVVFETRSHVAHDAIVKDDVYFETGGTIGGHVIVEHGARVGAGSAVHQFCRVGRYAVIRERAPVTGDVIPFGVIDHQGFLTGLSAGLSAQRSAGTADSRELSRFYNELFCGTGAFQDRVDAAMASDNPIESEIVAFIISERTRPLCMTRSCAGEKPTAL